MTLCPPWKRQRTAIITRLKINSTGTACCAQVFLFLYSNNPPSTRRETRVTLLEPGVARSPIIYYNSRKQVSLTVQPY
ncbi:hypothetical protein BDV40DRAFT_258813 [Aspergillus tamarii]|uniref:Uncharacterized protein n=1 Tax=Aspergillus tamarii TaxID=41984 RepID=A0A5N6V2I2_ASPTM|nr:hypothetical protein BDV40DRAFT_258813 [Aspergillus tamarii]